MVGEIKVAKIAEEAREKWRASISTNDTTQTFLWIDIVFSKDGEIVGVILRNDVREQWLTRMEIEALMAILEVYGFKPLSTVVELT